MSDYRIENDKLVGPNVSYVSTTKKSGGRLDPKFLVIHYTAGTNYESDVATLSTSDRPASCQLVIAADGRITQIGDFNDILWHAGKSAWKGYSGLNKYSIGIEFTDPGPLDGDKTWTGERLVDDKPYDFVFAKHKNGRDKERNWAGITGAQIEVGLAVGTLLMKHYGLKEAVGHDDIAPNRKQDPGPSVPYSFLAALNGNRDDDEDGERPELPAKGLLQVAGVAPETLTFRVAPKGDKRGELPERAIVEELDRNGNWVQVRTPAGHVGWVFGKYLVPAP